MARLAAACASLLMVIAAAGCGGDDTPVAHVGDATITHGQLVRQLGTVGVTPDLKGCIARFKSLGDGGLPLGTPAERCRYEHLRDLTSALATLIHTQWVRQEAKSEGVKATDADLKKARSYFGKDNVDEELVETVALDDKLRAKLAPAVVDQSEVDAAVKDLEALHGARRDVLVVGAGAAADGHAARRYLNTGTPFDRVAARYGDGEPTAINVPQLAQDDGLTGYDKGEQLRAAVFAAKVATLVGPVESDGRFYVFLVRTTYEKQKSQTADQLRGQVEDDLRVAKQGAEYERLLAARWLRKTRCEKGYVVSGNQIFLGGGVAFYNSSAGCGNFVPFKTPPPV